MLQKIQNGRENLLLYGKKTLLKKGYSGVSITELTSQCNMATGTFYNYFKSKDAFINMIVLNDWNILLKKVQKQMDKPQCPYENVRFLYDCLAEFQQKYRFFATGSVIKNQAIIQNERLALQKLYDVMAEKFRYESAAGTLKIGTSPENAAYMIVQSCMIAGRNPDMNFDDLWNFLHVTD